MKKESGAISREFDVIVWGATGFTGRLVAEYLLRQYGIDGELKWAMAGRSERKLDEIKAQLGEGRIPLVLADSNDPDSLRKMAARTKVICTTVGPYSLYGSDLVAACVEQGTDYCDLAGETPWIRRMIDQYHEAAQKKGCRIVPCCGFDSIPSDFAVYRIQQLAQAQWGESCQHVKMRLKSSKGKLSGGTFASMNQVLAAAHRDPAVAKVLYSPYTLNPDPTCKGPDQKDLMSVVYDNDVKSWLMPFIMASINTRVVRRSHALQGFPYGEDFVYDEAMMMGDGLSGRAKALIGLGVVGALSYGAEDSLYRRGLSMLMPKPGEGPNAQEREEGFFNFICVGKRRNGEVIKLKITGDRDPGYGSTSKMLGESAVCLALDPKPDSKTAGVLTPSTAMGDALLKRLEANAGVRFELIKD